MKIVFEKWNGAGNDFVVIDNRENFFDKNNTEIVKKICDRKFGIGADGMLLVEKGTSSYDFYMVYINNDGSIGSMCGNGGRVISSFAHNLGLIKNCHTKFLAIDGEHEAEIISKDEVKLKMQDMKGITIRGGLDFVFCGSTPHSVMYVENLKDFPVFDEGRRIRYTDANERGVNVNFVEIIPNSNHFPSRTYERGVEDETLACGTGACSIAVISHSKGLISGNSCIVEMPGGEIEISFDEPSNGEYKNIWLKGPVEFVFAGEIDL